MFARFPSTCPRCHSGIVSGAEILKPIGSRFYVHAHCPQAPAVSRFVPAPSYAPLTEADMGAYVAATNPDNIYCVRSAKGDDARRFYFAMRWTPIAGRRATATGEVQQGEFRTKQPNGEGWTRPVTRWIRDGKLRKMTAAEAQSFAVLYAWCPVHNGPLSDADSVDAGVGPVCAARMGWDRKALAEATRAARAATVAAERAATVAARTPEQTEARYAELFEDAGIEAMPAAFTATPQAAAHQARIDGYRNRGFSVSRSRWSRPSDDSLEDAAF